MKRRQAVGGIEIVRVAETGPCNEWLEARGTFGDRRCTRLNRFEVQAGEHPRMCLQHARMWARTIAPPAAQTADPLVSYPARPEPQPPVQPACTTLGVSGTGRGDGSLRT